MSKQAYDIPIIVSDAVPPGEMFMLPSDVTKAMDTCLEISNSAFWAVAIYWAAPLIFGRFWPLVVDDLRQIATRKLTALKYARAGFELTTYIAASEKRIGHIKNLPL